VSGERPRRSLAPYLIGDRSRGTTTDDVTDALREAILDGVLPASSWLREVDLAGEFGVSRTPVRDAIRRLVAEHLVIQVPNHGAQVTPMGLEDILAVYAVRESLEGLASRLAAQRGETQEASARLGVIHEALVAAAVRRDVPGAAYHNLVFHRAIRELAGNPYLERFLTLVEHSVRRFGASTFETPHRMDATIREHQAIMAAIEAGDGDDAERLARAHMRAAREARLASFLQANP
jgi:DNA-binding GntR family transcriptional regulator